MLTTDPYFADVYNPKILKQLERRYGPVRRHHLDLPISTEIMLDMVVKMNRKKPRRGEVVMVIPNEQGDIWLHTKSFYPAGVYRLMTGGLEPGEAPQRALRREVVEETGFKVEVRRCLAVITYTFTTQEIELPFVSYIFATTSTTGRPHPTDPGEAISHFQVAPPAALAETARQLRSLTGAFADWGIFRAIPHEIAYEQLLQNPLAS
jgi:8-oxo-dGTP pyrophosphatase MutT (NUDIX family)